MEDIRERTITFLNVDYGKTYDKITSSHFLQDTKSYTIGIWIALLFCILACL